MRWYEQNVIPKASLEIGCTYKGRCRNATYAVWKGRRFEYLRDKFGCKFYEEINHPEDDDGFDLFYPHEKV